MVYSNDEAPSWLTTLLYLQVAHDSQAFSFFVPNMQRAVGPVPHSRKPRRHQLPSDIHKYRKCIATAHKSCTLYCERQRSDHLLFAKWMYSPVEKKNSFPHSRLLTGALPVLGQLRLILPITNWAGPPGSNALDSSGQCPSPLSYGVCSVRLLTSQWIDTCMGSDVVVDTDESSSLGYSLGNCRSPTFRIRSLSRLMPHSPSPWMLNATTSNGCI